jgi:superfamily II DNA or RNA helicase
MKRSVQHIELLRKSKQSALEAVGRQYNCIIVVTGADARIDGSFPVDVVVNATSYFSPGYKFTQKYRSGLWDGRIKLFSKIKRTFPAGLANLVLEELRKHKVQVQLDDRRYCPNFTVHFPETLPGASFAHPFDFQPVCAFEMARRQRGIIGVATNGGKSTIAALFIAATKIPTLFMVPNRTLLYQTQKVLAQRLSLKLEEVGLIGDGHWEPKQWVTVSTADTLYARLTTPICIDFLKSIQLLIVDECHHQGADSWYMVSRACPAFYRFGLSGTPLKRSDGADLRLIGVTGPVIFEVKNKELVERKISVQPIIHFLKITKPLLPNKMPYREVHKLGIVENPYRNNEICKAVADFVEQGLSALIVVDEIKHGEILDKRLWTFKQKLFIPHQFINGQEEMEIRHKALDDFRRGDLKVLIATSILNEGLDMPNIDVLALAAGGKSLINLLQRIGRGLRRGGNSDQLHVIDTADFQHKYLLKHSLQRMQEYRDQDCFEIKVA